MRCAIVSDLHANLQAWRAVLLDIRSLGADRIICLGDMVGYGPSPVEVLESVYANVDHFVLGNHDAAACGKMDDGLFNDRARDILAWTRTRLGDSALRFLSGLPLTLRAPNFRCAHAGFHAPASFDYIIDGPDALPSWRAVPENLLFVGHTHRPFIHVLGTSGVPHLVPAQDFSVEPGKRYLVNVGSVGSPRDGGAQACYCLLDTDVAAVRWRTVPFDIDAYREALRAAGVDPEASAFLHADPRRGVAPLRELLSFRPPANPPALAGTAPVMELDLLRRRARRWMTAALAATVSLLGLAALGGTLAWRHATRGLALPAIPPPVERLSARDDGNLVCEPTAPAPAAGPGLVGWSLDMADHRRISATIERDPDDGAPVFALSSATERGRLALRSLPVPVRAGERLAMQALFATSEDFRGELALAAVLTRQDGDRLTTNANYQARAPSVRLSGGWTKATASFPVAARSQSIALEVRGTFRGRVRVKAIRLVRRGPAEIHPAPRESDGRPSDLAPGPPARGETGEHQEPVDR